MKFNWIKNSTHNINQCNHDNEWGIPQITLNQWINNPHITSNQWTNDINQWTNNPHIILNQWISNPHMNNSHVTLVNELIIPHNIKLMNFKLN